MADLAMDMSEFSFSALSGTSFESRGLRDHWDYRDFGVHASKFGDIGMHLLQAKPGDEYEEAETGWHYHVCELQLDHVIRGWVDMAVEGQGVLRLDAGTCYNTPSGKVHNALRFSPDFEVIGVMIPEVFETVSVEAPE